ncbi:MAG: SRPBCC family protein [Saccharopolyspora sp.]|uniref:SRPBCC family protein n=1 Tax=Saccharopolyspora TaxID=1835 RepID=UPI00190CA05F|nr:SRPBCC family protein [Saccharopolyspora sp.]MBK0865702.1 SRPBCC family protein [Saccharopolyspora sp. HNM0986]MBQ6641125.1 SRPBCC family protein [Saccharopolyspora sp.]
MQMQHHFTVPVPVDVAWPAMIDPEQVAPCMPGATLSSADGNEFAGSVKVKLGPISLLYKGKGSFEEVDEAARKVVIDASGKDSRGNGTAAATVTLTLTPEGGSTSAQVDTDLKVTGKPAQLGRGLMTEVGSKILNQFAANLAEKLAGEAAAAEGAGAASAGGSGKTESDKVAEAAQAAEDSAGEQRTTAAAAAAQGAEAARSRTPAWRVTPPAGEQAAGEQPDTVGSSSAARHARSDRADTVVTGGPMPTDEAIDLLGTAGTPVLKRVLPAVAVLAAGALLFRWLRRRKHRR